MISHRESAIYMSENLLEYTHYKHLQEFGINIINTETKCIEEN